MKPGAASFSGVAKITGGANGGAIHVENDSLVIEQYWPDAYCPAGNTYQIEFGGCSFQVEETHIDRGRGYQGAEGNVVSASCGSETTLTMPLTVLTGTLAFNHDTATLDVTMQEGADGGAVVIRAEFTGTRAE